MGENSGIQWTTRRYGPLAKPGRDGDREQARARVNQLVAKGKLPHPNELPCVDCGHRWVPGERRHEYDHHLGYAADNHLKVEPVCTRCHSKRDCAKARQTHCKFGHEYTAENAGRKTNGTRFCRACRRERDRKRKRPPGYWQRINAKRRAT